MFTPHPGRPSDIIWMTPILFRFAKDDTVFNLKNLLKTFKSNNDSYAFVTPEEADICIGALWTLNNSVAYDKLTNKNASTNVNKWRKDI